MWHTTLSNKFATKIPPHLKRCPAHSFASSFVCIFINCITCSFYRAIYRTAYVYARMRSSQALLDRHNWRNRSCTVCKQVRHALTWCARHVSAFRSRLSFRHETAVISHELESTYRPSLLRSRWTVCPSPDTSLLSCVQDMTLTNSFRHRESHSFVVSRDRHRYRITNKSAMHHVRRLWNTASVTAANGRTLATVCGLQLHPSRASVLGNDLGQVRQNSWIALLLDQLVPVRYSQGPL